MMPTQENLKSESTQIGKRLLSTVREYLDKSNTISEIEFNHVFGRMADENVSQEERDALSAKYRERFGPYEGVRIVNEEGTVVRQIQPLFRRLKSLKDTEGIKDPDRVTAILTNSQDTPQNKALQARMIDALIDVSETHIVDTSESTETTTTVAEVAGGFED